MRAPLKTMLRARSLRAAMTPPERFLWRRLSLLRAQGLHFRRQHPLGPYVLDFYCARSRLVIEVDGIGHRMEDRAERDERRDAWLEAQGLRVLRIPASDVLSRPDDVAEAIFRLAAALPPQSGHAP